MPKFRGFKASLNFGYTTNNQDEIENYPTGPENISLAGAYRANREEFFGYGSLSEPHKKITPAMVKLPPSRSEQPSTTSPVKNTRDLSQPLAEIPVVLRKGATDVSTNPGGRTVSENRDSANLQVKRDATKLPSKDQKLLERQQKKQKKIAEEKQAKLKKEQEKAEKEREKQEREREKEQAKQTKAAKRDKPKREKQSKSKAPPLPKTPQPTTVENSLLILDHLPTTTESQPFLTINQPKSNNELVVDQQQKTTEAVILAPPPTNQQVTASNSKPPPKVITQAPLIAIQQPKTTNEVPNQTKQPPKTTEEPKTPSRQPKAAQRTNPLSQSFPNYSTDTLDSNISRNTGPPPYDEIMPNKNDKAGNTSFGKRVDDSDNSWDLVSQHREQLSRPMARQRRPKQMVMDLQFDSGFVKDKAENSEA